MSYTALCDFHTFRSRKLSNNLARIGKFPPETSTFWADKPKSVLFKNSVHTNLSILLELNCCVCVCLYVCVFVLSGLY